MNSRFSLYLDILRFTAAILVFASHIPSFSNGLLWQISGLGHESVVIFFVLSGFVISYVVHDKKEGGRDYLLNRATRIYSVVLPALLLTLTLYFIGHNINPDAYARAYSKMLDASDTEIITRALTFTNQSWTAVGIFANLPYWSLGYEVWYYVLFGVIMFAQRYKLLLIAACLALMGPSIVLYLPIWWAGVLLHQHKDRIKLHRAVALTGSIVSVIAFAVISVESNTELLYQASMQITPVVLKHFLLEPAGYFMVDFLLAMMVVIHLLCVYHLTASAQSKFQKNWMSKNIQWLSTHTFSLYLFHMPILFFISAVLPATQSPTLNAFCILIATPISIGIMSMWIEANKHKLKAFFTSLIAR